MDFFEQWFEGFGQGLCALTDAERARLFRPCAERCARDALKYLYQDLFNDCGGDLDAFFSRLNEVRQVDGRVVERGRVYEIDFLQCTCDLHTRAGVNTDALCECSRQSLLCELETLLPGQTFDVARVSSILRGDARCVFRITRTAH